MGKGAENSWTHYPDYNVQWYSPDPAGLRDLQVLSLPASINCTVYTRCWVLRRMELHAASRHLRRVTTRDCLLRWRHRYHAVYGPLAIGTCSLRPWTQQSLYWIWGPFGIWPIMTGILSYLLSYLSSEDIFRMWGFLKDTALMNAPSHLDGNFLTIW